MGMIIETERLHLREMTQLDYPALCKILQDKEVMYAYEHPFSDEEVHEWLNKQLKRYEEYGFGLWAVVLKATNEMIGQCGLTCGIGMIDKFLKLDTCFKNRIGIKVMHLRRQLHASFMLLKS